MNDPRDPVSLAVALLAVVTLAAGVMLTFVYLAVLSF